LRIKNFKKENNEPVFRLIACNSRGLLVLDTALNGNLKSNGVFFSAVLLKDLHLAKESYIFLRLLELHT